VGGGKYSESSLALFPAEIEELLSLDENWKFKYYILYCMIIQDPTRVAFGIDGSVAGPSGHNEETRT
jgi:hypothetical protein